MGAGRRVLGCVSWRACGDFSVLAGEGQVGSLGRWRAREVSFCVGGPEGPRGGWGACEGDISVLRTGANLSCAREDILCRPDEGS